MASTADGGRGSPAGPERRNGAGGDGPGGAAAGSGPGGAAGGGGAGGDAPRAHGPQTPFGRALTGLGAGALTTALLLVVNVLGALTVLPNVAFSVFEWFTRVLPGSLVVFGLENTLRLLEALGFSIKDTAKTVEEVMALTGMFLTGTLIGMLFFLVVRTDESGRARLYGLGTGAALGATALTLVLAEQPPNAQVSSVTVAVWVIAQWIAWGWGVARLYSATTPSPGLAEAQYRAAAQPAPAGRDWVAAEVQRLDRRRFIIRMGGLAATIAVAGAEVAEVLRVEGGTKPARLVKAPIPFPNADSPVKPVPGTRAEYTAPEDHYRVDINLSPPEIDEASWRLRLSGLVAQPAVFTLQQLKSDFPAVSRFITLSCVSNPVGGPLIGTTLWTGLRFRDLLASAQPLPDAHFAHLLSEDGYDEIVDLPSIQDDPRVMLVYAWNGQPLLPEHGHPLRLYRPGHYGMKQPKWITEIALVRDEIEGYWVERGWDAVARMKTTSVIDVVARDRLQRRGGRTLVPVGGIAHAGDRGISKVEIRVDDGPWESATLRATLSGLTWVIWRYEWPFVEGTHVFAVRAFDGTGALQPTEPHQPFPSGASGIDTETTVLLQVQS